MITGYLLSLAAVIPVTGWAARRFGAKRVYMVSLVLFTAGSALCGLAGSLTSLVVFRVLQGAGGGMIMPVAMMIMAQVAGPQQMGKVMGIVSMPAMIAPILGPVVGGLILEHLHWSWIFFVNVPIGAIAFTLGWRMLPRTDPGRRGVWTCWAWRCCRRVRGAHLRRQRARLGRSAGLGQVIVPVVAGIALTVLFCLHALRVERPLLDIRMYANRVFAGAAFTNFGLGAALFGAMILVPLYYQSVRGQDVISTGLLTGPQGIGALVAMPLASRLTERFGGGRVALAGVSLLCLSTIPLTFIGAHTSIVAISVVLVVRGLSIGMCFMPAMTAAFASMRPEQVSDATPQLNVLQRTGGAIGTAVLAVVLQRAGVDALTPEPHASAFDTAYWWALGIAALTLIPCTMLLRAERPPGWTPTRARPSSGRPSSGPWRRETRQHSDARRARPGQPAGPASRGGAERLAVSVEVAQEAEAVGGGAARARQGVSSDLPRPSRMRGRDTHLGAGELSHAQCELLFELEERGELPAGELACAAQLSPATVTQMLDHLADGGHVERARLERDRRVVVSRLTPQGRRDRSQAREVAGPLGAGAGGRRRRGAARRHARADPPAGRLRGRRCRGRFRACRGRRAGIESSAIVGLRSAGGLGVRTAPAVGRNDNMKTLST